MIIFESDDDAYLAWLREHAGGYVLNVRATRDPNYVVLHRASCRSIARQLPELGGYTCRAYRKIVACNVQELKAAAIQQGRRDGTFSRLCSRCQPLAGRP